MLGITVIDDLNIQ